MNLNRKIVISTMVLMFVGAVQAISKKSGISRVLLGGYMLMLVLSLLDLFGPPLSTIAGGIAMLAVIAAIIASKAATDIFTLIGSVNTAYESPASASSTLSTKVQTSGSVGASAPTGTVSL